MKLNLHRLAIKIFQFCVKHSIRWEVQWIPRTENEKADYISRLIDFDDWQITHDLFVSLEELWGPHTVDCFANYYTAKLPRFFSCFWNPGASGIDFFARELSSENCLVLFLLLLALSIISAYRKRWLLLLYHYGLRPVFGLFWRANIGLSLKDALRWMHPKLSP